MSTTRACCVFDPVYPRTVPGILKIVEAVLCIVAFICAIIRTYYWTRIGMGWVQFVTISACIAVMVIFFIYLFHIVDRLHAIFALLVLIFYIIWDIFLLIAGILAAVRADQYWHVRGSGSVAAAAAFTLLALVFFIIDTYLQFKGWRITRTTSGGTSTTTTVTTHSTYVSKA